MAGSHGDQVCSNSHDAILVLRLVLDGEAQLLRGELVDTDAVSQGRFKSMAGLIEAVKRWLDLQQRDLIPGRDRRT